MRHWNFSALLLFAVLTTAAPAKPKATTAAPPKIDHVLVLKRQHKLLLLNGKHVVKTYRVALGFGGLGPKRELGDGKTPEGSYVIDYRNPESKFHLALHISYPQVAQKRRAQRLGVDPGGDIMIHGLPPESSWMGAKHRTSDWTNGCIAVTDKEIEEIWRLVPDGTPVVLRH